MMLTGLIKRSSLDPFEQEDLLDRIGELRPYELPKIIQYLEVHQLDVTQLVNYTNKDIHKRLDYIDAYEKA